MKSRKNMIFKYFYKNGFTLVELLAVIVILAVIMIVAIPSVLTVMQTARKKSFVEYATKVYNVSNQKYTADSLTESGQPTCIIYDIVNDLDLSNVGSYKGYVAVSKDTGVVKYYITLYDETYMLVAYNYSDKKNNKLEEVGIDDSLLDYSEEDKDTVLTVEYLASITTNDCVYTVINPDGSREAKNVDAGNAIRKDISTLNTGNQINVLWKKLINNEVTDYYTDDNSIKSIVKTSTPPAEGVETVVISDGNEKQEETISWYQDGIIYVYSKANRIYANKKSYYLFYCMKALESIDISIFDFSNTEEFSYMFYGTAFTTIDLTKLNTSKATGMAGFIGNCSNLTNIIGIEDLDVSKCQSMFSFFAFDPLITNLDLSKWDVSNVVTLYSLFYGCTNLKSVNLSNWKTSKATEMYALFAECQNLTSVDMSNWDTSNVAYMVKLFYKCQNLVNIDMSNWDTSNVYSMSYIFYDCRKLTSLDLSGWDVSKVEVFSYAFCNCISLTNINMAGWDTSRVYNFSFMFHNCHSLEYIDVSHFNTSNARYIDHMFNSADNSPSSIKYGKLKSIDVSNWDVSKVESMAWFIEDQKSITTLDLSGWDTSNCKSFNEVFSRMTNLKTIYVSEKFVVSPDSEGRDSLFWDCKSLVGQNGTKYSSKKISYKYAVIDTPETPGYFTKKE